MLSPRFTNGIVMQIINIDKHPGCISFDLITCLHDLLAYVQILTHMLALALNGSPALPSYLHWGHLNNLFNRMWYIIKKTWLAKIKESPDINPHSLTLTLASVLPVLHVREAECSTWCSLTSSYQANQTQSNEGELFQLHPNFSAEQLERHGDGSGSCIDVSSVIVPVH